jgi:hypothetical protein
MRGGLYTVEDLATWMRCKRAEVERLMAEDHLPKVEIPGAKRAKKIKIAPRALCHWLNARSSTPWTVDGLIEDIDRALRATAELNRVEVTA